MLCAKSNRVRQYAALGCLSAVFALAVPRAGFADPPTSIPAGGFLPYDPSAIAYNTWLLYPAINFLAENSNNYFISPQSKISGWALGVSPSVTAEWSNGIHTTTLFGSFQQLNYLSDSAINESNGEGTFTQQYAPLRDLNFTVSGDYAHQTISPGLTSAIPSPTGFTGTQVLPDGNIVLPNGTIVTPTGQVVGQVGPTSSVSPISIVNPYDQFTGTASVQKLFSDGIVTLGASVQRVDYDEQGTPNFTNKTFTEDGSFWLGSIFYAYSDGVFSTRTTDPDSSSTAYRIVGGIGTRQVGFFRLSAYFGHQGTSEAGSESAGGNVYGGTLAYYPTPAWTLSANVDETLNYAPANAGPTTQALSIPAITPLQVPVTSSTQITATSLRSSYIINPQWTLTNLFGFTRIQFIGSPLWDNSWVADTTLRYDIWRNLSLTWEYQYSSIISNAPFTSADRNLVTMSATYRFN
jgi:hypothetical protein